MWVRGRASLARATAGSPPHVVRGSPAHGIPGEPSIAPRRRAAALAALALLGAATTLAATGATGPGATGPVLWAIEGTNRAGHLVGTARAEAITGYGGDDRIDDDGGGDYIDGREGDDVITTPDAPGAAHLMGGPGDDAILARGWAPTRCTDRAATIASPPVSARTPCSGAWATMYSWAGRATTPRAAAQGIDRLSDGSNGAGLLDGGAGDDAITSSPRGMDRVVCGEGRDAVSVDALESLTPIARRSCAHPCRSGPRR